MFDNFFDKHVPEAIELPSAESAVRIDSMLREKMNGIQEEKPMKKKTVKSFILIAAAAVLTATALIFSATADYNSDDKYIVRINNKKVDADIVSYEEGRIKLDIVSYEVPCEVMIDKNGKPVTEDSDIDRRVFEYILHLYASDDPEKQVWDPQRGVEVLSTGGGCHERYLGDAMLIPVPNGGGGTNLFDLPAVLEFHYDEKQTKEFWENYRKNPVEEAEKWAEYCASYTKEERSVSEVLKDKISKHFNDKMTEAEKNGILEFIDQNFGEDLAE